MNRLAFFQARRGTNRYWWFGLNDYLPDLYAVLSEEEFALLAQWFEETDQAPKCGECNVPAMSALLGFVAGNGIERIVQAGHFAGYSTLLLGWALRRMGKRSALFSMDIDAAMTAFTQQWIERAGLQEIVRLAVGDSSDPEMPGSAQEYLGGAPQLVFIDSSHQYAHTLRELDLWYEALAGGGLIFLHDVGSFAQNYDRTRQGGVMRAMADWQGAGPQALLSLNRIYVPGTRLVYQDACGLGILQKP